MNVDLRPCRDLGPHELAGGGVDGGPAGRGFELSLGFTQDRFPIPDARLHLRYPAGR